MPAMRNWYECEPCPGRAQARDRRWSLGSLWLALTLLTAWFSSPGRAADAPGIPAYRRQATWARTLTAIRRARREAELSTSAGRVSPEAWWQRLQVDFPVECDWALQDGGLDVAPWLSASTDAAWERRVIRHALKGPTDAGPGPGEFHALSTEASGAEDPRWLELYSAVCSRRRAARLATVRAAAPRIVFTTRRTIRPSFFAYTEGQSDAQNERHFLPGSELCLLELDGVEIRVRTLRSDPEGVIRDPAVSWDGERVTFAWKKSLEADDYHLYELDVASDRLRPITSGQGFADYEPAYLPDGNLVFASTRCVQTVDCWWTEVSNLYTCDPEGRHLRRLTFDQVHSVFPQVLADGRVLYTRWDYNDRGQTFPQPLFQMRPDGTGQSEFYGNNSWFPTTIAHARGIPGTECVVAILCGHHTSQAGKLAVIDPARGRQENQGVQLVAPIRETPAVRVDAYGQSGELWQYPYALNAREFLVGYAPRGWAGAEARKSNDADFGIYWMDADGRRELLASDPDWPCQQPVPLVPRKRPPQHPSPVDPARETGAYYLQDIYAGSGLAGIPRGTVARLRVVALEFRAAGVGNNGSRGPGGAALISTPVAVGNGTWDVKRVLGETPVHSDGSAYFRVPARTPVYFQAIDTNGFAIQTMRSWSTLQPGENQSCVGCHDRRNTAPPTAGYRGSLALAAGLRDLEPFPGPPRGFSFPTRVQPILDRHCVRCHHRRDQRPERIRLPSSPVTQPDPAWEVALPAVRYAGSAAVPAGNGTANEATAGFPEKPAFSLLGATVEDRLAKRRWSDGYLNLTLAQPSDNDWDRGSFAGTWDGRMVNWIGSQSIPGPLPPYAAGAGRSALFPLLADGHYGVRLAREEWDTLACWIDLLVPYCGEYTEAGAWTDAERAYYRRYADKRQRMEEVERENLRAWEQSRGGRSPTPD